MVQGYGKTKYMKKCSYMEWYNNGMKSKKKGSRIWISFMKVKKWIKENLLWEIGIGLVIRVGIDPILGICDSYTLSKSIIKHLHGIGVTFIKHIVELTKHAEPFTKWKESVALNIDNTDVTIWNRYLNQLKWVRIMIGIEDDSLRWNGTLIHGEIC